jgi:hypothetical protein
MPRVAVQANSPMPSTATILRHQRERHRFAMARATDAPAATIQSRAMSVIGELKMSSRSCTMKVTSRASRMPAPSAIAAVSTQARVGRRSSRNAKTRIASA